MIRRIALCMVATRAKVTTVVIVKEGAKGKATRFAQRACGEGGESEGVGIEGDEDEEEGGGGSYCGGGEGEDNLGE